MNKIHILRSNSTTENGRPTEVVRNICTLTEIAIYQIQEEK